MRRRKRERRERQLMQRRLIEWWAPRAAFNERLALLTDELSDESPPEAFADAIVEVRRLQPLFEGCPDPELDLLNRSRRDLLIEAPRLAEAGDFDGASALLDDVASVTDRAVIRMELLFSG